MCQSRKHVFWHLIGIGTTPEIHSIQFQDHTMQVTQVFTFAQTSKSMLEFESISVAKTFPVKVAIALDPKVSKSA